MWVHEGFTSYSETLFTEFHFGKEAGTAYVTGIRANIENDRPVIGPYGVNREGSGDMYYKGSNMLHTIRQVIGDDEKFRAVLRGMNQAFYHQTVTSKQVEAYISRESGKKLDKVFDQYLRTTKIPVLELKADGTRVQFRWANVIEGFDMPVRIRAGTYMWLQPKPNVWSSIEIPAGVSRDAITIDPNFFVELKKDL